jgi:hypothetical protein
MRHLPHLPQCSYGHGLETKFLSPFGSRNFSSLDWYFSQIPLPNTIHLFIIKSCCRVITERLLKVTINKNNPVEPTSIQFNLLCQNISFAHSRFDSKISHFVHRSYFPYDRYNATTRPFSLPFQ